MHRVQQAIVTFSSDEGFASGCLILASVARAIAAEQQRFGVAGSGQFTELAEVFEAKAAGKLPEAGRRETARRPALRLVQE